MKSTRQLAAAKDALPGGSRNELIVWQERFSAKMRELRSPIVAVFDEDGGLYVGEMTDYPYNTNQPVKVAWQDKRLPSDGTPLGTVRLLRDTDGDGKAEIRKKVYTSFGTQNQQGGVNSLMLSDISTGTALRDARQTDRTTCFRIPVMKSGV